MSTRDSLFEFLRRTVLRRPSLNVKTLPYPAGSQFVQRFREALGPADLIRSLLRHTQKLRDLGNAHESHISSVYPLTTSSARAYTALDNVKKEGMDVQDATELLMWIIEDSAELRKGSEMSYLAEQAIEEAADYLAEALTC